MATLNELISIKQRVEAQFLSRPGVTGVDVGYKETGGVRTDTVAIRIHVAEKKKRVPADEMVPKDVEGAVTDVLERRYEPQVASKQVTVGLQADTVHYSALEGGISIGPSRAVNGFVFAGTLGAVVVDNVSGQHAALTNFHVACVDSTWQVGDRQVQPSRIDTGVPPGSEFGAISRAMITSNVDGAVLSIDGGRANSATIVDIGTVRGTKPAALGMAVRKRGRTTLLTYGTVDGLAGTVNVDYGDGIGVRTLSNQISVASDTTRNPLFSDHGDSGSVVVDVSGYVIGLLFAGSGTSTVVNPIAAVQSELNISVLVGKALIKDLKDGRKDFVKDRVKDFKEKDLKELRKDLIKDGTKDIKDRIKDRMPDKSRVVDGKQLKDIRDVVGPGPVGPGDPVEHPISPIRPDLPGIGGGLDARLAAVEEQLARLSGFISAEERPDLAASAFGGEAAMSAEEEAALRAELEAQVDDAVVAKAEFDAPLS